LPLIDDNGDVHIAADSRGDGIGSIVLSTGGVERARISPTGVGTGWAGVLGGSITAFVAAPSGDTTGVTDSAKIAAAVASLPAAGGKVSFAAGTYYINSTITVGIDNVLFEGSGKHGTWLQKAADVVMIDASGTHTGGVTTGTRKRFQMRDMSLKSDVTQTTWVQPMLRLYYGSMHSFWNCEWFNNFGPCVQTVECYDSYFFGCRFDSSGGIDGTKPAVNILQNDGTGGGAFGSSTDNSNNLWFVSCVWETYRDGALWIQGAGSGALRCNQCYVVNCKFESTNLAGTPAIKINFCEDIGFVNTVISFNGFYSGSFTTPINQIEIANSKVINFDQHKGYCINGATQSVRTHFSLQGGNDFIRIRGASFSANAVNKPSVAAIEFTSANGTNTNVGIDRVGYYSNPGSANLYSGAADSILYITREEVRRAALKIVSETMPRAAASAGAAWTAQDLRATAIPLRAGDVVSNLVGLVQAAPGTPANLTKAQLGLYDSTGRLLATCADCHVDFQSTGIHVEAVSSVWNGASYVAGSSYQIQADGLYYLAYWLDGTSMPSIARGASFTGTGTAIGTGQIEATFNGAQASLPNTVTFAAANTPLWGAVS
jgi:hypothetical protein